MSMDGSYSKKTEIAKLTPQDKVGLFKFYEEAAEKTKAHAWTHTSWILTLNAGVLGFSISYYLDHLTDPLFIIIEILSTLVGLVLCWFLYDVLKELGRHIRNYWTSANKIASEYPPLILFIGDKTANEVKEKGDAYKAIFPPFCKRLQRLAILFAFAHLGWLGVMVFK